MIGIAASQGLGVGVIPLRHRRITRLSPMRPALALNAPLVFHAITEDMNDEKWSTALRKA